MDALLGCSRSVPAALAAVVLSLGSGAVAGGQGTADTAEFRAVLSAAVPIAGARAEIVGLDRPVSACVTTGPGARIETSRPIEGSGRVAVKLTGARPDGATCDVWAWARVKVFAKVPITRRAVRAGDALEPVAQAEEREIKPGHLPAIWDAVTAAGAVADRSLGAGQLIEADCVRAPGLRAGETVKILIVSGALTIEQIGHALPCTRGRSCAVLPSGKRVEGTLVDGRLMVQMP